VPLVCRSALHESPDDILPILHCWVKSFLCFLCILCKSETCPSGYGSALPAFAACGLATSREGRGAGRPRKIENCQLKIFKCPVAFVSQIRIIDGQPRCVGLGYVLSGSAHRQLCVI
jgi:hypothetical protein